MIFLRKSITACISYRPQFVAGYGHITRQLKTVKVPVTKDSVAITPRESRKANTTEESTSRKGISSRQMVNATTKAKTSKITPNGKAAKQSGQPRNRKNKLKKSSPETVSKKSGASAKVTVSSKSSKSKTPTGTAKPLKSSSKCHPNGKSTDIKGKMSNNTDTSQGPSDAVENPALTLSSFETNQEAKGTPSTSEKSEKGDYSQLAMDQSCATINTSVTTRIPTTCIPGISNSKNSKDISSTPFKQQPDWSTFLFDVFDTKSNQKVVDLIQPSSFEKLVDEYSYETKMRKKALEKKRNRPKFKSFNLINYDQLTKLGVGSYKLNDNGPNELTVSINKQHLLLAHDSLVPAITIRQPECLNFANPTGLVSLEQIGQSLIYEYLLKWSLMNMFNPHRMWDAFVTKCKGLQFIQLDDAATIQFTGLQPLSVFVAMVYLEDKDYDYCIMKFLQQLVASHRINTDFTTDLLIGKYVPEIDIYLQQFPTPINFNIFSQVFRPPMLNSLSFKLPALPKFHNQELYKLAQVSLLSPRTASFAQYPNVVFLREQLDSLGDAILKRYSVEYMIHYCKTTYQFKWNMDDVHFLNRNILFSRLALAYKLHQGLNEPDNRAKMEQVITGSLDVANELLGDMLERMVAIEYLDDPEVCRNWVFKIYDVIIANLTKKQGGIEFLDKEKYVLLYELHLKTKTMY
ncbi:hypothetical protein CANMA_003086 [Candida margitis]|uniref:uncharacterized protein n=1 Tax=Candida margitis TaxID=1775924 RepID=UPI0022265045|nr:uncharacterized protein CANMA_003086 [Candida margitis]KAI5967266.1 hypothetical protein CANMA_003086 [Candida margitis]